MTESSGRQWQRGWTLALGGSVLLAAVLYLLAMLLVDADETLAAIDRLSLVIWLWVLGLSLCNYALRFMRWQYYLHKLGAVIPVLQHLLIYLAGFTLTTTPGKAGEALRSVYLSRWQVSYTHSLAALFTERLVDMAAICLLAALVLLEINQYRAWLILIGLAVISGLLLLHQPWFIHWLQRLAAGLPARPVRRLFEHFINLLQASIRLLSGRMLAGGLVLGLVSWGAEGLGLYLILHGLGAEASWAMACGIYALAVLVGALSFIPGGLGSTEAAMAGLLILTGVDAPAAVAATLICRVATLWFAVLLGALALLPLTLQRTGLAGHAD